MLIRNESAEETAAIRDLTARAFRGAPHASGTEAGIVDALRAAGALTLSLVAVDDGRIVGHAAASEVRIDRMPGLWHGLGPVSVDPGHQRRGTGSALVRATLERLRGLGSAGCVVLGDPAFYGRFGFANDPALAYDDIPPPYLQRLVFSGAPPTGQVTYHSAFDS